MSNFTLNHAMRSFTDLTEAARTYDAVFDAWTRAGAPAAAPCPPRPLRADGRGSGRRDARLARFPRPALGREGARQPGSAAERGHVRTASYAQVTEPIYQRVRRAAGSATAIKWRRCCRSSRPGPSGWATRSKKAGQGQWLCGPAISSRQRPSIVAAAIGKPMAAARVGTISTVSTACCCSKPARPRRQKMIGTFRS